MSEPRCNGSVHIIPIPPDYTVQDVWDEITTLGHLMPYEGEPAWANITCHGGIHCRCYLIDRDTATSDTPNPHL